MEATDLVEKIKFLAKLEQPEAIREELQAVRSEDLADAIERVTVPEAIAILRAVPSVLASDTLVDLPTETARQIMKELPDRVLAHYLDILPMDDAIDLQEELEPERFESLLQVIPLEDAKEIRRLLTYPEDSVGRMMTERYFWVRPDQKMDEVIADLRMAPDEKYETVHDIYVLNEEHVLLGVVSLRRALRAGGDVTTEVVMNRDVVSSVVTESAEEAARKMARYGFFALPVVDLGGHMLGVFTGDDAQTVLRTAETEDVLALGGVSGDAESYLSLNVWQLVKRRLPWLFALFVAETATGFVLRHYGESQNLNPLTFFIPLLIGAGGNSGSQVTTTITRALALGDITASDWLTIIRKEFLTACGIGTVLGLTGALRASLWGSSPALSLVVGLALPAIVIWATTVGSMLPLLARRLKIDPAVMSAPFITTFVDATGLIIYFEIALALAAT